MLSFVPFYYIIWFHDTIKVEIEDLKAKLSTDLESFPEVLNHCLDLIEKNKDFIEMIGSYYCVLFFKNIT